jgi:[ribosomal protein S18]-alanine N-acetyltransferase
MQAGDLDAVMALEAICFPSPWSRAMYAHEISANPYGSYWVLDGLPSHRTPAPAQSEQHTLPQVLAYGGIWIIAEEAHITTIASHPAWRRRGLAGRLLIHLLTVAKTNGATSATLEARANNRAAIALYEKLGFVEVGVRKGYYVDTGEDARLLTLYGLDTPQVWERLAAAQREFQAQLMR